MICRAIPYEGKEAYLFVSYCHADQEKLYPLFEQMASEGCRMWYDEGNRPGEDWLENIENHLEQSSACLAFISASSSLSHNCKREIIYALKCRKKVIPVLIEDVELPKGLRMQLVDMHYLKRWDFPSDGELLKKLFKTKELKDCKADSSSGLLRTVTQLSSPEREEPLPERKNTLFTQLLRGSLKPKAPLAAQEPSAELVPESVSAEAEQHRRGATARKVQILSRRVKPETQTPPVLSETPSADPEDSWVEEDSEDEKTILLKPMYLPDDEGTVLLDDFDDEKTIAVPRFSPALLLYPGKNRAFILSKPQISLGRSPLKCDVVIDGNSSISKHHANIIMLNGRFYLSDAGSTNGTFLDGERLEPGKQNELESTAVFKLQEELLIFYSGPGVSQLIRRKNVCFLINEEKSSVRVIDQEVFPLDRTHRWPDGTLADQTVHRNAHASICLDEKGCTLKDENSRNGTKLNDILLNQGASAPLNSGDRITLGHTTLHFYSISLKGDN